MVTSLRGVSISAVLSLTAVITSAQADADGGISERVRDLVVAIEVRPPNAAGETAAGATGFGIIVAADNDHLYVVTALHILTNEPGGRPTSQEEAAKGARASTRSARLRLCQDPASERFGVVPGEGVSGIDVARDLAVLRIVKPRGFSWNANVIDQHGLQFDEGAEPEIRLVRSADKGGCETSPAIAKIGSREKEGKFTTDGLPADPGSSGTPVFTTLGVLGIVREDWNATRNECVSIAAIRNWMRQQDLPFHLVPFTPKRLSFTAGVSYSRTGLGLDLPRDLRYHTNHLDDWYLTGDPGTTDLQRAWVDTAEAEGGLRYRLGAGGLALATSYAVRIPLASSGRSERQQANDSRPPSVGSFIYSKVTQVGLSHALRAGLEWTHPLSSIRGWWLEVEGLLEVDRWVVTLEKGWSRYGWDQPELTSKATGYAFGPTARVSIGTGAVRLHLTASLPHMTLGFAQPQLEATSASGVSFSAGFGFRTSRKPWGE